MTRAGIAFGSNIADRLRHLTMARTMLAELSNVRPPMLASAVYETEPVGCPPAAESFLNAVVEIGWQGDAPMLHQALRGIEIELGRPAPHERNAPRKIDLDLLYFGDAPVTTPGLTVPHPRMHERRFVLQPLADIRPELVLPTELSSIAELLRDLPETPRVMTADAQW
jgi:2-amino-4-hydroxy-6-hydroxymethyldihydropteridine diphosphokinase